MTRDDDRQRDDPAEADEVHDVEGLLAVLDDLADEAVDLVEDAHAGQDRPQHEDHDDAGDAQRHREQERRSSSPTTGRPARR